ncbi:MAG TPA: hypothetical protein VN832_02070 [Stellaceae bacterium]|nr:hypothetical protein [Stellaceae bacterium]
MLARQIVIGFGIAVVFPLLVYYGVATFSAPPNFQDAYGNLPFLDPLKATPEERKARTDLVQERQKAFNLRAEAFSRILIMVATPLGIAAMLIGAYLPQKDIGTGLILGGVLTVADGYWTYWEHLPDWLRFVSLLLGFVALLFIGYRRFAVAQR